MIELHSKINTVCGKSFFNMLVITTPLSSSIKTTCKCPFIDTTCTIPNCNVTEYDVEYKFEAEFKCKKWWKFWKKHFIENHFSHNEGNYQEEIYPRKCNCGEEIYLIQRRIR